MSWCNDLETINRVRAVRGLEPLMLPLQEQRLGYLTPRIQPEDIAAWGDRWLAAREKRLRILARALIVCAVIFAALGGWLCYELSR